MSADLSGFTAMSERLSIKGKRGVEELTAAINSCFTALIDVAAAFDGDVLKFGGDALLLWFGDGDSAVRAVRAAVRMQRVLATRFRTVGLAMSIGVHRDSFDAFLVGRPDWRELVLAGAAVSATVALESEAAPGEVRVSPATAAALPEGWTVASGDTGWVIDHDRLGRSSARRAERHWVDPELARLLVAPPLRDEVRALAASAGEHRLATVVFAEVTGTDAAVAAGAHDFARSIDGLLRSVQDDADRLGTLLLGTDVVADGVKIILVSGAPVSTGYDEEAALRFATELVRDAPLHVLRAGVNRGRIFAGFLGSPDRRTYTVMGDPVNLAARADGQGRDRPGRGDEGDGATKRRALRGRRSPAVPRQGQNPTCHRPHRGTSLGRSPGSRRRRAPDRGARRRTRTVAWCNRPRDRGCREGHRDRRRSWHREVPAARRGPGRRAYDDLRDGVPALRRALALRGAAAAAPVGVWDHRRRRPRPQDGSSPSSCPGSRPRRCRCCRSSRRHWAQT